MFSLRKNRYRILLHSRKTYQIQHHHYLIESWPNEHVPSDIVLSIATKLVHLVFLYFLVCRSVVVQHYYKQFPPLMYGIMYQTICPAVREVLCTEINSYASIHLYPIPSRKNQTEMTIFIRPSSGKLLSIKLVSGNCSSSIEPAHHIRALPENYLFVRLLSSIFHLQSLKNEKRQTNKQTSKA